MNRLKDNLFWFAVVGVLLALGGLSWFLVIEPIYGSGPQTFDSREKRLGSLLSKATGYVDSEHAPTERYRDRLLLNLETQRNDYNEGADFYEKQRKAFKEYFGGRPRRPQLGTFETRYRQSLEVLIENYRTQFAIKASEEDRGEIPPEIQDVTVIATKEHIDTAMKQYWITEAIVKTLTEMSLGGLKKIDFAPPAPGETEQPYNVIVVEVAGDLPLSMLEDLITRLFENERVLFTLTSVSASKTAEQLQPFMRAVVKNDTPKEPSVAMDFVFQVIDLKDETLARLAPAQDLMTEDEEESEEEDDDDGDDDRGSRRPRS